MGLYNKKSSFFVFGMIIRFFLSASDGSTLKKDVYKRQALIELKRAFHHPYTKLIHSELPTDTTHNAKRCKI